MPYAFNPLSCICLTSLPLGLIAAIALPGYGTDTSLHTGTQQGHPIVPANELAQVVAPIPIPEQEPLSPLPEELPEPSLPSPDELLQSPPASTADDPNNTAESDATFCVAGFDISGNISAFSREELIEVAENAVFPREESSEGEGPSPTPEPCPVKEAGQAINGYKLTFADLVRARTAVTQHYVSHDYETSGAFIPEQTQKQGRIEIQVIEGSLEAINISGNKRLNSNYVSSRIALASSPPVNRKRLLKGLRLLQQDPLIESVSARLSTGTRAGSNILDVEIQEAEPFRADLVLNNDRTIAVGTFNRGAALTHSNFLGLGDGLSVSYSNTDGSNTLGAGYSVPLNPRNGTLTFNYERGWSSIIQPEFDVLGIESESKFYELKFRQPIYKTPSEELALGVGASLRESQLTFDFLGEELPLATFGSDGQGITRVFALRFNQDWTRRGTRQVLAARSQFSLGLDALNSTINASSPDSEFFSWVGQGQWVYLLDRDTVFVMRGNVQLADRPLVPMEQITLGGRQTVRGYRQNLFSTDNGVTASAEVRLPIYRAPDIRGVLQVIPFIDFGAGWNHGRANPSPNTLTSVGIGLGWQQGDTLTARLDWGFPLTEVQDSSGNSLQEEGIYFSLVFSPF